MFMKLHSVCKRYSVISNLLTSNRFNYLNHMKNYFYSFNSLKHKTINKMCYNSRDYMYAVLNYIALFSSRV